MKESSFQLLQTGSNSQIFLHGANIVLKMVDVSFPKQTRHLHNEFTVMRPLNHPNILKVHSLKLNVPIKECFRNVLLMEYAEHGSLLNYLKKNSILKVADKMPLALQLLHVVQYLHNIQQVAHRDIKLDNILVKKNKKNQIKILLSDFGFAIKNQLKCTDFKAHSYKGTKRGYMPPEIHMLNQNPNLAYDPFKADVFSLGVVLFCLFFNKLPFEQAIKTDKNYSILCGDSQCKKQFWLKHRITQELFPQFALLPEFKDLLEQMWQFNTENRPSIKQVMQMQWVRMLLSNDTQQK